MTDTARTVAVLKTDLFADGQPKGSISPQDARDMIATWDARSAISATEYGTVGDGVADDTTALQAAINAAITQNKPLFVPAGTYKTTAGLTASAINFVMYGAGGSRTIIAPTSNTTYHALTIGPGVAGSGATPSGELAHVMVQGPSDRPTGYKAAVMLDGMRHFKVDEVRADRFSIGFDLKNNCYGTKFYGCRTLFGSCNVGLNLQTGAQSGSDLDFYDCWLHGNTAGVHIAGGGGGYHFYGGQISSGQNLTVADDTLGSVIISKDYETGATGRTGNVTFDGIDFEGTAFAWIFRCYDAHELSCHGCSFLASAPAGDAIGVLKTTFGHVRAHRFVGNSISGNWSSTALISIAGIDTGYSLYEESWAAVTPAKINGVSQGSNWLPSLAWQAQLPYGVSFFGNNSHQVMMLGGSTPLFLRNNAGAFEKSTDYPLATWVLV